MTERTGEWIENITLICFEQMQEELMRLRPSFDAFEVLKQRSRSPRCDFSNYTKAAVLETYLGDLELYSKICQKPRRGADTELTSFWRKL